MIVDNIPKDQIKFQKIIISQLTGEKSIKTKNGNEILISSRWNAKEKKHSALYLKSLIKEIGLEPEVHSYSLPNLNFGVDLLIEPLKGNNIFTLLPSTIKSDEYVIMGAHYDTGAENVPGAIDNGSGIALILSVLHRSQQQQQRNKNLIVVFFDQEEEDISAGSRAFAKYLKKQSFQLHSVHTYDMIGWDSDNNKEVELALPNTVIENLYKKHAEQLNIPINITAVNSSDHYSFIKEGIDAVCVSQAYTKRDNSGKKDTPDDKYHLVNFEYLDSSTNLAYEVIKDILHD